LIQRPTASPNVVKSKVVDVRPLPPAVTAARSPLTPSKPTVRMAAPTGIGVVSTAKVAAG
jgi:hypothetical protein